MPGDSWGGLNGEALDVMSAKKQSSNLVESGVFSGQESNVSEAEADIYALLEQKERDLLLAAELGKALLEKNEELSQTNEKMAEDFSSKLEVSNFIKIRLVFTGIMLNLVGHKYSSCHSVKLRVIFVLDTFANIQKNH